MAGLANTVTASEVFYSYSHKDEDLRDELERHLSILKRSGIIQVWYDRKIDAGTEWAGQIHEHLNRADVILLLISADFLASDYCYDVEMKRALERHRAGEAIVIPIILRPVDWSGAPFAKVQCLPTDGRPVTAWPNRDEAFCNVAQGIRRAVLSMVRPPGTEVQERVLDAAIPSQVPVGRSSELLTIIRRLGSEGLRAILRIEESYDATEEDVKSKPFRLEFPCDISGKLEPQVLTVQIASTDLRVTDPCKQIRVPPDGDSEPCLFLVTAQRAGRLTLVVEVLHEGITVASRLLQTHGEEAPRFLGSGTYQLACLPLTVLAYRAPPPSPPCAAPAFRSLPGEETSKASSPISLPEPPPFPSRVPPPQASSAGWWRVLVALSVLAALFVLYFLMKR